LDGGFGLVYYTNTKAFLNGMTILLSPFEYLLSGSMELLSTFPILLSSFVGLLSALPLLLSTSKIQLQTS